MDFDEIQCPQCETTKHKNPNLVVNISTCGHSLCTNCIDSLFAKGVGNCPQCKTILRRSDFRLQLFQDNEVEREVYIRKKVMKDVYRREEEFPSSKAYDDYMEDVETIILDLAFNTNVDEANQKLEMYRSQNKSKNKSKYTEDALAELEAQIKFENQRDDQRRKQVEKEFLIKQNETLMKERLLDELSYSENDAKTILDQFDHYNQDLPLLPVDTANTTTHINNNNNNNNNSNDNIIIINNNNNNNNSAGVTRNGTSDSVQYPFKPATHFSSGQVIGGVMPSSSSSVFKLPKMDLGTRYIYQPLEMKTEGPEFPSDEQIVIRAYANLMRKPTPLEEYSGLNINTVCKRLLQEAMAGLCYQSPVVVAKSDKK